MAKKETLLEYKIRITKAAVHYKLIAYQYRLYLFLLKEQLGKNK